LFVKKGGRTAKPQISITAAGHIGINAACIEKYFKNNSFAQLYGDRNNKIIGIKPIDKEIEGVYKLTRSGDRSSGSIAGRSFLNYYQIDLSKSKKFKPEWDDKREMLIIKLE